MKGKIARWECPRNCGYYREWHAHNDYLQELLFHPLYGLVTGEELVQLDIATHSCGLSRYSHSKAEQARMAREEMPNVYPKHGIPIHSPHAPGAGLGPIRTRGREGLRNGGALSGVLQNSTIGGRPDNGVHHPERQD